MENNTIQAFRVIKTIPYTCLRPNTIIKQIDGDKYGYENNIIPFLTDELIKKYCKPVTLYKPKFPRNSKVSFFHKGKYEAIKTGIIADFNEIENEYRITYQLNNRTYSKWMAENDIIQSRQYYYLDSDGIIKSDYEQLNKEGAEWRKMVGNFFSSRSSCQEYKDSLINQNNLKYIKPLQ